MLAVLCGACLPLLLVQQVGAQQRRGFVLNPSQLAAAGDACNVFDEQHVCADVLIDGAMFPLRTKQGCKCPARWRCPSSPAQTVLAPRCSPAAGRGAHAWLCHMRCSPDDAFTDFDRKSTAADKSHARRQDERFLDDNEIEGSEEPVEKKLNSVPLPYRSVLHSSHILYRTPGK